jgi:hypothetical protein
MGDHTLTRFRKRQRGHIAILPPPL